MVKPAEKPVLEENFPDYYRAEIIQQIFANIDKNESFSFIGMKDNAKVNTLRFLSSRIDIKRKYLKNKANQYLYILVDFNELVEVTPIGIWHLLGLSIIETLKKEKIDFHYPNNIFIDNPILSLKSLKEDLRMIIEKTGKSIVIMFNAMDVIENFNLDLFSRNLIALRNSARYKITYIFTGPRPLTPKQFFFQKIVWALPFTGIDAEGVVKRNLKRYGVYINTSQIKQIIHLSGGHAGIIKFIVQALSHLKDDDPNSVLENLENERDICFQCERILAPLTDIEKAKLMIGQEDEYLINIGLQVEKDKLFIPFSPILEKHLKENEHCISPFCYDKGNNELYFLGKPIMKELTIKESDLLKLLIEEPNRIFKREEIMVKIWREEEFPSDWAYDKLISRLREKLNNISNASYLKTIHGVGLSLT